MFLQTEELVHHPIFLRLRRVCKVVSEFGYSIADDRIRKCKRFGGVCDDTKSTDPESNLKRDEYYDEEEIKKFLDRIVEENRLIGEEDFYYKEYVSDHVDFLSNHPETGEPFSKKHKRLLAKKFFGFMKDSQAMFYCFENCKFGRMRLLLNPYQVYLQIASDLASPLQTEGAGIWDSQDIKLMLLMAGIDIDDPWMIFFAKKIVTDYIRGQKRASADRMEDQRKEMEKKKKEQASKSKK